MIKNNIKKECSSKHSPQQQELIDVISAELNDFRLSQIDLVSNLAERKFKLAELKEILEEQIEFVGRAGSVAKIIGLRGLYLFCKHIKNNFVQMQNQAINQNDIVDSRLLNWPEVIQDYLVDPNEQNNIQKALGFLSHEKFPITLDQQEKITIEEQFYNSSIQVDKNERIRIATPELVSLDVSDEIDIDIIENVKLDLPKQTENLSMAVRGLCGDDFINQLEIATKIAHTIKGASNIVGIQGIANLTHYLEDIFEILLKAKKKPPNMLYRSLLSATDCLEEMSEYLEGFGPEPDNAVTVFQDILNWVNSIEAHGLTDHVEFEVESGNDIAKSPANVTSSPDPESLNESSSDLSLRVAAKLVDELLDNSSESIITSEQIAELILLLKSSIQNLITNNKKVKLRAHEIEHLIELRGLASRLGQQNKITDFDSLELDQFDELYTSANQLVEATEDSFEFSGEIQDTLLLLEKHANNQVRNLQESQETVLRIRMVPIKCIVPRLKRAVRQACKSSNKLAELNITGEDTLVDSEIIHQLADPIMHILRNAIDHGIESPDVRVEKGKDAQGSIHLGFNIEGNSILVTCEDDGRSLDLDRIKSKAVEMKLLSENEAFDNENAIQMILRHGFSTKDKVSQLSGRGVGLAAVHTKIMEMKGTINIDTSDANGLNVEISIPTNLNSVHALFVNCGDTKVAISNRGIDEILYAGAGKIVSVSGKSYFEYMQQRFPVYDLRFMLELSKNNTPLNNKVTLLVSDGVSNKYAVTIDKIHDTRDIITKPINEFIPSVSGLLGTTILADGSITTVIDMVELLKHANTLENKNIPNIPVIEQDLHLPYALVVEDSISTRKALAQFMQDLGFTAITAVDGVQALNQIQKHLPSIVLTDLEMPRMNGLELSAHLRSNAETAFTPIIMVTSKSSLKHKLEAEQAGVTAYVTKPYDEDELLEIINSLNLIEHVIA